MRIPGCVLLVLVAAACRPPGYGQGDDAPSVDAAIDADPAAIDAAPADAAPPDGPAVTCDAPFRLEGHAGAVSVWLTGDFVSWAGQPADGAVPLALGGDGAWTVVHTFGAGTYQYKFIVDGTSWIADPGNPDTIDDGFGGVNSLYICGGN